MSFTIETMSIFKVKKYKYFINKKNVKKTKHHKIIYPLINKASREFMLIFCLYK